MPHSMRRPSKPAAAPGSTPSLTVSLKSLRNPPLDLSLSSQSPTTSIHDLKQLVAENIGSVGTDKIRLLYKKKPCPDSKTLKDVIGDDGPAGGEVEFSVMVIGGVQTSAGGESSAATAPDVSSGGTGKEEDTKMEDAPVAQGQSGKEVMDSEEFWQDLQGFLVQRIRDQGVAERAFGAFREVWREKRG